MSRRTSSLQHHERRADRNTADEPAADQADSTIRLQAVPAPGVTEDGELLKLVRIGGEDDPRTGPGGPMAPR